MEDLNRQIKEIRREYNAQELSQSEVPETPFHLFKKWLEEALISEVEEPNAFTLSTMGEQYPDSRVVLLRDIQDEGFSFYTNYNSKKAGDLLQNPFVSVNFFWVELFRQIRIKAKAKKLPSEISDDYFASRPRDSQIGAWASQQSQLMESRAELEKNFEAIEKKFAGKEVPRPENWGGYLLEPSYFEFWQGRPSRLHDRIVYEREKGQWEIKRLYP